MSIARSLRFGVRMNVISFHDGRWWWIDMTGARRGPIDRKGAYLTAVSYMDAREIADYDAAGAKALIDAECAAGYGSKHSVGE